MLALVLRTSALLATGTWSGIIAYLSLVPRIGFVERSPYQAIIANLGHLGMYVVLAALLWGSLALLAQVAARRPSRRDLALVFAAATAYGVMMELLQGLVPNRSPSWTDAILDAAGAGIGLVIGALMLRAIAGHPSLPRQLANLMR